MNEEKNNSFDEEKEEIKPDEKLDEQSVPQEEKPSIDEVADSLELEDEPLPPADADFTSAENEITGGEDISDADFDPGPPPGDDNGPLREKPSIDEVSETFEIEDENSGEEPKKPEEENVLPDENDLNLEEIEPGTLDQEQEKQEAGELPENDNADFENIAPLDSGEEQIGNESLGEETEPIEDIEDEGLEDIDLNLDEFGSKDDVSSDEIPAEEIEDEIKDIESEFGISDSPPPSEEKEPEAFAPEETQEETLPAEEELVPENIEEEPSPQEPPPADEEKMEKPKKSRTGFILLTVIILTIAGGAYLYMDTIISLITGAPAEVHIVSPPEPEAPPIPPAPPEYDSPFIYTAATNVSRDVSDGIVTFSWQTSDRIEDVREFFKSRLEAMDYIIEKDDFNKSAGLAHMVFTREDAGRLAVVLRYRENVVSAHVSHVR